MKVTARRLENLQVEITTNGHRLVADEPVGIGDGAGPDPYVLLLSALGSCKIMTVVMYARKKGWPLENVEISLDTYRVHAKDCKDCESNPNAKVAVIDVDIQFTGDLSAEQITRLHEISERCPVHRTLTGEININSQARKAT
jgi:putative redox protein